ncbi:MAG TPA: helix-hairpin-helix domain-containing protein [Vicinamibacterales bacterium]|nr:helix-hairpin-helix domain-containing protein [Vicinamibacterales bacterium]
MIRTILAVAALATTWTVVSPLAMTGGQSSTPQQQGAAQPSAPAVNLNTATQADLEKLPGVGPSTAKLILEYRQKNNGFKKVEELMNVKGIGEKSFLKLKPLVTVAPPKTLEG